MSRRSCRRKFRVKASAFGNPVIARYPQEMTPVGVVSVVPLFPKLHSKLMELLSGLGENDWNLPTACPQWSVRDIAPHLLDSQIRKLSHTPYRFLPPPP